MKRRTSISTIAMALAVTAIAAILPQSLQAHSKEFTPTIVDRLAAPYLAVQTALAKDDLEASKIGATQFIEAMKAAPRDGDAKEESEALESQAQAIAKADDIAAARLAFHELSKEVITLVRHMGTTRKEPLFIVHCPMAFNNKGADWIQDSKTISNPYFGASMLRCGSVKGETGIGGTHAPKTDDHAGHH